MRRRAKLLLLSLGLLACDGDQHSNPVKALFAAAPHPSAASGPAVAFRFPAAGGEHAVLFRLPTLSEVAWRFEAGSNTIRRTVGFAGDEDLVFVQSDSLELVALDLTSGRARIVDTNVALATLGPTGIVYSVRTNGSVARLERRSLVEWPDTFSIMPTHIWGAVRDRLLALIPAGDGPRLELLSSGQPPVSQRVPEGTVAVAAWGDAAAIGTDSGLVIIDPAADEPPRFRRLEGVKLLCFSPSAHRIYAVTSGNTLVEIERFELDVVDELTLPGPASDVRLDPLGRALLIRPASGDSIWLVDLNRWSLTGTVPGAWDENLPAVAPDGTLLIRRDGTIVGFPLDRLTVAGEAADRDGDRWLVAGWDPRRPALELATEAAPEPEPPGQPLYVQVSSTSNQAWADDLAMNLRRAGLNAGVLAPTTEDEPFRVVLGPFLTREEAEEIGRRLGMPYWIFTRDTTKVPL